jgi:hypothetical protein
MSDDPKGTIGVGIGFMTYRPRRVRHSRELGAQIGDWGRKWDKSGPALPRPHSTFGQSC